jgi:hypothetical protein
MTTLLENRCCADYFTGEFDLTSAGAIDTWDYQWLLTLWRENGLAVNPARNLVSNIGFGPGALYCTNAEDRCANVRIRPMRFPLTHPPQVARNLEADRYLIERILVPSQRRQTSQWRTWLRNFRAKHRLRTRIRNLARGSD